MSPSGPDYYAILGLSRSASTSEINTAFRHLAKQYHPDVNPHPGALEYFVQINEAHRVLSDASARTAYDWDVDHGRQTAHGNSAGAYNDEALRGIWFVSVKPSTFWDGGTQWRSGAFVTVMLVLAVLATIAASSPPATSSCDPANFGRVVSSITDNFNKATSAHDLKAEAQAASDGLARLSPSGCGQSVHSAVDTYRTSLQQIKDSANSAAAATDQADPTGVYASSLQALQSAIQQSNAAIDRLNALIQATPSP